MPRTSRKKAPEYCYHIMNRSISELNLFQCDDDKQYYLTLLKRYTEKYYCAIYAYCLMDNHVHLFINPKGFDISKFMHCLNSAYVAYYNKCYKRHGHLFQGRFASTIVEDDKYALALSAYIHNNSKDIEGYSGREEYFPYSSYGIYLGIRNDVNELVDKGFILKYFSKEPEKAAEKYHEFTQHMRDTGIMLKKINQDIWNAYTENEYRSEKEFILRNNNPDELIKKACELLKEDMPEGLRARHNREKGSTRAFLTYIIRVLCGCTYKNICKYIGNISLSGVTRLASEGFRLMKTHSLYRDAFSKIVMEL